MPRSREHLQHSCSSRGIIVGAAIGDCVHVAGVLNFLRLAEEQGFETIFLGPAVPISQVVDVAKKVHPEIVGVSYRLSPEPAQALFAELKEKLTLAGLTSLRFVLGGTPPVCKVASNFNLFEATFDGTEGDDDVIAYLRGFAIKRHDQVPPQNLVDRIRYKAPHPIIRHHFGLPSLEATLKGVRELAESGVLDVISLGPDQNAQESFFRPEEMDSSQHGAGGVPIRSREDLLRLYEASRCGNYPLMRSYSGTRDLIRMAELLHETIHLAWGAIPLMWYNVLDGRSRRDLQDSIAEAQAVVRWHAEHNIPVEINEAHHWSLRDAHDTIAVAMAFLAAYNAKKLGVKHYVSQYMFNTPPGTSPKMDLAKMLAKDELISSLTDGNMHVFRQTRTGLASLSTNLNVAKGQLAASTVIQLALKPHIIHVVGFCEADHAATPDDIIESVQIAKGVIKNSLSGMPDLTADPEIEARKAELISEAKVLLNALWALGKDVSEDPWTDPATLAKAVRLGLLDAPHLKGNSTARGQLKTRIVDGACKAIDDKTGKPISESERIHRLLKHAGETSSISSTL